MRRTTRLPPTSFECTGGPSYRRVNPVKQRPQRVGKADFGIVIGCQIGVDSGRHGTARAMPEHDDEPQAFAQVANCVINAPQTFDPQHVAGDPDDEEIVGRLVEDQLDGHAGIRAAQSKGKRRLSRRGPCDSGQAHRQYVARNNDLRGGRSAHELPLQLLENCRITVVPASKVLDRLVGILDRPAFDQLERIISVDYVHSTASKFV